MSRSTRLPVAIAALVLGAVVVTGTVAAPAPARAEPLRGTHGQYVAETGHPPVELLDGPEGTRTDKTLVIGLDGARLDKIKNANTPNMQGLMAEGVTGPGLLYAPAYGANLDRGASTSSGPGWSTILTGVWPDKHGVYNNSFVGKQFDEFPNFLSRMEALDPSISTYAAADWSPIASDSAGGPIIPDDIDVRIGLKAGSDGFGYAIDDQRLADASARYLKEQDPDAAFVYFGQPDIAGHNFGADDPRYSQSLEVADRQVGQLLTAIEERPTYAQEKWTIMVTTDHGHRPQGGHGGPELTERQTFVIASGHQVKRGLKRGVTVDGVKVVDIASTAISNAGLTVDPAWNLDGVEVGRHTVDEFDSLRSQLTPARDENLPANRLGFTHTPPKGWSIDNSKMPSGGTAEWVGWTFTTNEFWSSADKAQGRENFIRGRDVIAVADSDEWDDRPHGVGRFDSTLNTPAYKVKKSESVSLTFQNFYQQEGSQTAEVLVSWDGAPATVAAAFTENANGRAEVTVDVPEGANEVQFGFHYTGTNNWYWGIDDVQFMPGGVKGSAG